MVSQPQLRILAWLSNHPSSLEKEWDVTRAISLPGIAEGLGVVRSALNSPLTVLEQNGLITKRMAHVIGGGSRRRQVYHITNAGRRLTVTEASQLDNTKLSRKIIGKPPPLGEIFGRDVEVDNCLKILASNSLIISGMPGVGKTALIGKLVKQLPQNQIIRWSTGNKFADFSTICRAWQFSHTLPRDIESICLNLDGKAEILILDDYHTINKRHINKVNNLLQSLASTGRLRVIVVTRELSTSLESFANFKLGPLDVESCCAILGTELELSVTQNIARSLGCHPLALKLYQPRFGVPETNDDIINYVENVVLQNLEPRHRDQISLLALEPMPVSSERSVIVDQIAVFDDQNLLQWHQETKLELQHLVRNVTRANLSNEQRERGHSKLAEHWKTLSKDAESNHYLYHLAQVNQANFVELVAAKLADNVEFDSAALAVIVNELIEQSGEDKDLRYLASKISAYRFEADELRDHIAYLDGIKATEMTFRLAELDGRKADCESLIEPLMVQFTPFQKNRFLLAIASQLVDDRLPNQKIPRESIAKAESYLERLSFTDQQESRQPLLVAATVIRYSIAISKGDGLRADEIINSLEKVTAINNSTVVNLRAKQAILRFENQSITIEELCEIVEASCKLIDNPLLSNSLRLRMLEVILSHDLERVKLWFAGLTPPDFFPRSKTSLRYCARWWLLHSSIHPELAKSSLKESLLRYRESGCVNAAEQLESKLHSLI